MLPQNGRIIIVDDKIDEARPLMDILSKRRMPFNYYSGQDQNDFPEDPAFNKFRVLFLDLNIFESDTSVKSVISVLNRIIQSLIPDNPNPYLLIIWSKKKKQYSEALAEHFDQVLPSKKPAETVFLHKQDYFDINENGAWEPREGCLELINEHLNAELSRLSLLGNLFAWENVVHQNSCDTLNEFSSFYPVDENWDKNSKAVIYSLAKSVVGNDFVDSLTDNERLAAAVSALNSFLSDKLENAVHQNVLGDITGINNQGIEIPKPVIAKINSKLHIFPVNPLPDQTEQGNVYFLDNAQLQMVEKIICAKTCETQAKLTEILESQPILIQLDLTPVCDYSQNKEYVRLISGVLLSGRFYKKYCKNSNFCYKTPIFYIEGEEKFMLFDFRFIETSSKDVVQGKGMVPAFKLRKEICTDIQSQLANQVNRPGISNL